MVKNRNKNKSLTGFEPAACGFAAHRSTTELQRQI